MSKLNIKTIFILSLIGFGCPPLQYSIEAKADDVPETLVGADLKQEDAVVKCDIIFVGTITDLGHASLEAAGGYTYHPKVDVSEILKGKLDAEVKIIMQVRKRVGMIKEKNPQVGHPYIFFFKKDELGWLKAVKLLDATDANITRVKGLIAQITK